MIAERLYRGATAEELGLSETAYLSRMETLKAFLEEVPVPHDFERQYMAWLAEINQTDIPSTETSCCAEDGEGTEPPLPKIGTMLRNLVVSGKVWARQGFSFVEKEEQQRRWEVCQRCEHLVGGTRCAKCGCFMKVKSQLAGMTCPDGRW